MLSALAVAGLLALWLVGSGGGDTGGKDNAGGSKGSHPVPSITPGPSRPGPAISDRPGGRDDPGDGSAPGGSAGGGSADPSAGADGGGDADADTAGAVGGSQAGGDSGTEVPAGSELRVCTSKAVRLSLHSVPNSYGPGENPRIQLTARNTSAGACKIDLGPEHTVLTITRTDGDKRVWASGDCPQHRGSLYVEVPAGDSITRTTTWTRKPTAPHCATPAATAVSAGTYLVEAEPPGFSRIQTSFVLDAD